MSESFNVSISFLINWAKNWKVSIWFKRKKKKFWDFRVFNFALYPRSKAPKSRKFRLRWIITPIVIQDLKTPKNQLRQKLKRKNSEISEFSILLYTQNRKLGNFGKCSFNSDFDSLKPKRMRYGSRRKMHFNAG